MRTGVIVYLSMAFKKFMGPFMYVLYRHNVSPIHLDQLMVYLYGRDIFRTQKLDKTMWNAIGGICYWWLHSYHTVISVATDHKIRKKNQCCPFNPINIPKQFQVNWTSFNANYKNGNLTFVTTLIMGIKIQGFYSRVGKIVDACHTFFFLNLRVFSGKFRIWEGKFFSFTPICSCWWLSS